MTAPYPIIDQHSLDAASRRRLLGMSLGGRTRGQEIPRTLTHQILIYRINGQYRLDSGLGLAHEDVVNADHVSVVDMSRDKQVLVGLSIPSQDAENFQVEVTFVCTVTDPLVVLREGTPAQPALLSYLNGHHKIVQLGLAYPLAAINDVRIDVDAEIRALATIRPPALPGMLVSLASVQVATPSELADFHKRARDLKHTHTLDSLQQSYTQDLDQGHREHEKEMAQTGQEHDLHLDSRRRQHESAMAHARLEGDRLQGTEAQRHQLALDEERTRFENAKAIMQQQHERGITARSQRNRQELDQESMLFENAKAITQQQHAHQLGAEGHRHELAIKAERNEFALRELEKAQEVLGTDPLLALQFAFQAGEISAREVAAGAQAHQDRQRDHKERELDREHQLQMLELKWAREAQVKTESEATEEQRFIRAIRGDLVREFIKKGYLDTVDPEVLASDLLGELTGGPGTARPVLPRGDDGAPGSREEDGPIVRTEDVD